MKKMLLLLALFQFNNIGNAMTYNEIKRYLNIKEPISRYTFSKAVERKANNGSLFIFRATKCIVKRTSVLPASDGKIIEITVYSCVRPDKYRFFPDALYSAGVYNNKKYTRFKKGDILIISKVGYTPMYGGVGFLY